MTKYKTNYNSNKISNNKNYTKKIIVYSMNGNEKSVDKVVKKLQEAWRWNNKFPWQ